MLELVITMCLAADTNACATRLLPGACVGQRAVDWVAARPELTLAGWSCADPATAIPALDVAEVAPGVFVHTGKQELADARNEGDEANIGFVVGTEAVAVIDAGGSRPVAEALYAAIRRRTDLPIGWLVLTHMHPDHTLGTEFFSEAGARVIGHARLTDALLNRADTYAAARRAMGPLVAAGAEVTPPDTVVAERFEIDLGGRKLGLEAFPTAHTDNDLTVLDMATGTWWMGDLVVDRQTPSMDGSVLGWLALLDTLAARPAARVVPGHGAATLAWPAGVGPTRDYLAALVAETRAALADGESLSTATAHLGQDLRGDWLLFDDFNARNATAIYRELEWNRNPALDIP